MGEATPTYLIALCEERVPHFDDRRVVQLLHDLQLAVLVPLVLEHLLDRHGLPGFRM